MPDGGMLGRRYLERGHLVCGHDIALAQLARDGKTAWCYLCEERVEVTDA